MLHQLCLPAGDNYRARSVPNSSLKIDLRQLRVVVVHPRDREGELLFRYLQRLGCQVDLTWPPSDHCEPGVDLLFCLVDPQARSMLDATTELGRTAIVAVA